MVHAGFKEEFDAYVQNAGLEDFVSDKCKQYYQLTDSFVRRFEFSSKRNTHSVLFDLYDKSYTMDLEDFIDACKIPQWGILSEPRKTEYNDFLASITVGETRNITQATIGSIHFPAIHYFALFIGRCINGKHDHSHLCASDLSVLKCAVMGDKRYNLGAIIARRLHLNAKDGDFFGGIYATRLANYLGVPIKENDIELPPAFLDYDAMVRYQFLERNEQSLLYRLIFDRQRAVHITLPAPAFFNFQVKQRYFITREEANEYEREVEAARLRAAALQAVAAASQYNPNYDFGYPPGQPWP
jgi:hypothetical protein